MQDKLFDVADQVVLVCGGRRGIGRALAQGFAERDAPVIIPRPEAGKLRQTAKEISSGKHPVAFEVCDVAKPQDVDRLVGGVLKKIGRIDTLLSVAGVNKRMKAEDYTLEEYDRIVNINLRGAFAIAQAVGRPIDCRQG